MNAQLKQRYLAEIAKAWGDDEKMMKFFASKVSVIAELPSGGLIAFDKPSIQTEFCFGYSTPPIGDDYDSATRMAQHARVNEDYFLEKNLSSLQSTLDYLNDEPEMFLLWRTSYYRQKEPLNIFDVVHYLNYFALQKAKTNGYDTMGGCNVIVPTDEDLEVIKASYQEQYDKFKTRLETYLKRNGMSKIRTWTYWRDE